MTIAAAGMTIRWNSFLSLELNECVNVNIERVYKWGSPATYPAHSSRSAR